MGHLVILRPSPSQSTTPPYPTIPPPSTRLGSKLRTRTTFTSSHIILIHININTLMHLHRPFMYLIDAAFVFCNPRHPHTPPPHPTPSRLLKTTNSNYSIFLHSVSHSQDLPFMHLIDAAFGFRNPRHPHTPGSGSGHGDPVPGRTFA